MAKAKKKIWVISGTHWDREWRYTADQSLGRLAELMDDLLDVLEKNPDFTCFHLDGGTIIVEDYLAIRPENKERLEKLMKEGRAVSVPWYTLPEMNTVAPESLIRNLLVGMRTDKQIGGTMKTGYTATSYGQISQLPQIYAGFDLNSAYSYRGTNKHQVAPICHWESPDGTRIYHIRCFDEMTRNSWFFYVHYELVLGKDPRDLRIKYDEKNLPVHMADETMYDTAFQLMYEDMRFKDDPESLRSALRHFAAHGEMQAIGDNLLALDMEDNAVPYVNLPKYIKALNDVQDDYDIILASLDDHVDAAVSAVKDKDIPVQRGEMRYAAIEAGFNGLLGATHSSRVKLKLLNHLAETELIRIAEPLCSMASMLGAEYPRSMLERAWLKLLKSHAHDSICGAAIDNAHDDMPSRFQDTIQLSRESSRKAVEAIWARLDTAKDFKEGDLTITLFNPLPASRKGVTPVIIDTPITDFGDIYIEPCTGAGPIFEDIDVDKLITYNYFDIVDEKGNVIPHSVVEKEEITIEVERKLDSNAIVYNLVRHRMLLDVDVPPMGYRTYALRPRIRKYINDPQHGADRGLIGQPGGILENEFIKVAFNPNGTFDLTDKKTGRTIAGMHYFAENGSVGTAHANKKPLRDRTITSLGNAAKITLVENNKMRATWQVDLELQVPAAADLSSRNRFTEMTPMPITSWFTLCKGSQRLEVKTRFTNNARDHRLRVMLPTDIKTNVVNAESAFDVIERNFQWLVTAENHEGHFPEQPMLHFVDLNDDKQGLALMSKGLREYEVVDDARRTLAITLMRSHRAYMRALKGPMTPEEYDRNPGQHSIGTFEVEYAVMPHTGDWRDAGALTASREFITPWRAIQGVPKPGEQPVSQSLFTLEPAGQVHVEAFCQAEEGEGYVMRIWNSGDEAIEAGFTTALAVKSVEKVRMDEMKSFGPLAAKDGGWAVPLRAKEIATLYLK